jgi:hypothetical protein
MGKRADSRDTAPERTDTQNPAWAESDDESARERWPRICNRSGGSNCYGARAWRLRTLCGKELAIAVSGSPSNFLSRHLSLINSNSLKMMAATWHQTICGAGTGLLLMEGYYAYRGRTFDDMPAGSMSSQYGPRYDQDYDYG